MKVATAMGEFNDLRAEIIEVLEENPVALTSGRDPHTGDEWYKVDGLPKPRPEWGIKVGSIGHHARSALDQMVYALAFEGGGNPESNRTTFPIYMSRDDYFRVSTKTKLSNRDMALAGVDEKWREKIDGLQPYHRGNMAIFDPLATLVHMTNLDKHRATNTPNFALETPLYTAGLKSFQHPKSLKITYNIFENPHMPREIDAGDLGRMSRRHPKKWAYFFDRKQRNDGKLAATIVFGGIANTYVYPGQIKAAIERVAVILDEFEPAFGPSV